MPEELKNNNEAGPSSNFIYDLIDEDIESGRVDKDKIITRFPPEPNGYLHIGHAKALLIDFLTAQRYNGRCNLRYDDTNPVKENVEYAESMQEDIKWLGLQWDGLYYASDYFDTMYGCAVRLVKNGGLCMRSKRRTDKRVQRYAYRAGQGKSYTGTRSVEENLDLLAA
jgi:glutaminyl-tRNA synthetase